MLKQLRYERCDFRHSTTLSYSLESCALCCAFYTQLIKLTGIECHQGPLILNINSWLLEGRVKILILYGAWVTQWIDTHFPPWSVTHQFWYLPSHMFWVSYWFWPCPKGFSPHPPVFLRLQKPTCLHSNLIWTSLKCQKHEPMAREIRQLKLHK